MEFFYWKVMLWSPINEFGRFYNSSFKMWLNNRQTFEYFTSKFLGVGIKMLSWNRCCWIIFWNILLSRMKILRVIAQVWVRAWTLWIRVVIIWILVIRIRVNERLLNFLWSQVQTANFLYGSIYLCSNWLNLRLNYHRNLYSFELLVCDNG